MTAFTFYSTDGQGNQIGNACFAPTSSDTDHFEATNWVRSLNPSASDDTVVIVGHSYGGNRARLFAYELLQKYNIPTTLLVTIDPIDWDVCSIESGIVQLSLGLPVTHLCDQRSSSYARGATTELSFRQTLGFLALGVSVPVEGYSLAGTKAIVIQNDYHDVIDDDPMVQAIIIGKILSLTGQ